MTIPSGMVVYGLREETLFRRYAEDNHEPALVHVVTRALIGIGHVVHEVVGHAEFHFQKFPVFVSWARYLYPTIRFPGIDVLDA